MQRSPSKTAYNTKEVCDKSNIFRKWKYKAVVVPNSHQKPQTMTLRASYFVLEHPGDLR